jgi:acyl-CoA synthetase (AMP-forming)/AMP-acid ligase II
MDVRYRSSQIQSEVEPKPPHDSLVAAFEAAARDDAPFVTLHTSSGAVSRRAGEAWTSSWRWSAVLRSRGVRPGDRVPLLMPTGHAFVEALVGVMLAGAIPVPLATPMTFGGVDRYVRNLSAVIDDCDARLLITYPRIGDAVAADPALAGQLRDVVTEAALDGVVVAPWRIPSIGAADPAFIQYTSGTTGSPKGAVISHRALVTNAFAIAHGLGIGPGDVGASWLPLFHDMGLVGVLLTSICHPYPVHVMPPQSFVMNPERWLDLIAKVGATLSPAPNFAYDLCVQRVRERPDLRLDSWRVALNGAEPVHAQTVDRFLEHFGPNGFAAGAMMPVYGMAEATLAVTFPTPGSRCTTLSVSRDALERSRRAVASVEEGAHAHRAVGVGRPVAGTTVRVVDDAGRVLPEGTVGQIVISGPSLMSEYFGNDDASAAAIVGGWLHSGDLGFVSDGELFVTGRAKDVIIKAGRNLYPSDIERVASEIDGVGGGAVAAFGRPNAVTGTDDLVVVAETRHSDAARRRSIATAIRAELLSVIGVKPDDIRVCAIGTIPRTTSGKIRRRQCARVFAVSDGA